MQAAANPPDVIDQLADSAAHVFQPHTHRQQHIVVLGDENGIHCAHQIATQSPVSRVILISAYPDSEFHRQGLEAGAVAFLDKKTLDTATLRQVIDDC